MRFRGAPRVSLYADRTTLEPSLAEADALRAWVAARPAGYVPPALAGEHPLVAIRAVPELPVDTWVRVVAVVVSAGELVTRPTRKGGDASMCTVLVADMSGCSIPLTIWAPTVQEIDVRESQIVDVKARTSVYKSAAQLSAFLEDCTLAASSVEAHELHASSADEV